MISETQPYWMLISEKEFNFNKLHEFSHKTIIIGIDYSEFILVYKRRNGQEGNQFYMAEFTSYKEFIIDRFLEGV